MTVVVRRLDALVTETVARHGGVRPIEQGEGDSFVAAFAHASDALACAVAQQIALGSHPWSGNSTVRMRMALHTGEVQLRDEANYAGAVINRCARLRDLAHGGQLIVSQTTRDLVVDQLPEGVHLRDLGSHQLRDLARPERVFQVCHPELRGDFPQFRSIEHARDTLPPRFTRFIGRDAESAELQRLLRSSRLVVLTGAGGCGKTRLAVEVAGRIANRFEDGVRFVDLAAITDPGLLAETVLSAIEAPFEDDRPAIDTVLAHLADQEVLVVLDNCEQLISACAGLATEVLTACSRVTILATSRERLDADGEVAWRLPSLSVPATGEASLEGVAHSEAVRLFVDRASKVRANFALTNDNREAVADICRRLDGIPLALELAAARTRVQSPAEIAAALEHRLNLLGSRRNAPSRHQTLAASLDWSYDLLPAPERVMLHRLSVFAGGFTVDSAERVAAGTPVEREAVLGLLTALVDKSLVVMDEHEGTSRYRLLETTRRYAAERLAASGDDEAETRNRHLGAFITLAEEAEPRLSPGPAQKLWLDRIESEHANVRAALEWSRRSSETESTLRLAGALVSFWATRGHGRDGSQWLRTALAAPSEASPELRAKALLGVAQLNWPGTDRETPLSAATEALAIIRETGDARGVVSALRLVGLNQLFSDPGAASFVLDQAATLARSFDDELAVADLLIASSLARFLCGDFAGMRGHLDESISVATAHTKHSRVLGNALVCLATVLALQGQIAQARENVEAGLGELRDVGDAFWPMFGLAVLGDTHSLCGRYAEAQSALDAARLQGRDCDSPVIIGLSCYCAGRTALALGDPAAARDQLHEAVSMSRALGIKLFLSWSLRELGLASCLVGDRDAAMEHVGEALTVAQEVGADQPVAMALYGLAFVAQHDGDRDEAESRWHEALRTQARTGDVIGLIDILEALAAVAARRESLEEAARLFGATETARERIGYARFAPNEDYIESQRQHVRSGLDPKECSARWAEGRVLSLDEACTYAARARGERKRPTSGWESLTPTELDVVRLVAQGLPNKAVAERLFVSPSTVKTHLSSAFAKLGVANRSALTAEAVRRGI